MYVLDICKGQIKKNASAYQSGLRLAIASFLAYLFYLSFDLQFGYWAVVTVAAIMQPNLAMTNFKAWLRLLGTLAGVAISFVAIFATKMIPNSFLIWFFLALFIATLLTVYNRKYGYASFISGLTIVIILSTYDQTPQWLHNVVINRTVDVIAGIFITWVCAKLIFPKVSNTSTSTTSNHKVDHPIKYALFVASSATVSVIPWIIFKYPGGYWAPFSCLAVVEENFAKTHKKALARFFAHVVVMIIAGVFSFFLDSFWGTSIALIVGMFIFGYALEKPLWPFEASIATTMGIAYGTVLLSAPGEINTWHTILARFLNTTFGIAIGLLVTSLANRKASRPE